MTHNTAKRSRILEIIIALLLVRPTLLTIFSFYSLDGDDVRRMILNQALYGLLVTVPPAILIITRKYDRAWSKLLMGVSLAANIFTSDGLRYVTNFGLYVQNIRYGIGIFASNMGAMTLFLLSVAAAIVVLLMMFGVIKWKDRKTMFICLYILAGLAVMSALVSRQRSVILMTMLLMMIFMHETQEKTDVKAVIGWIGVFFGAAADIFFDYKLNSIINPIESDSGFLDYLQSTVQFGTGLVFFRTIAYAAAMALIPLIMFERKEPLERVVTPPDTDDEEDEDESDDND
ncbi:hypothetical protein [Ruminococcus flavefaciens]|uniref:hypothetical protein n=1 Tax=Ruminococcus flavefaciens TaxID=1265 RepID=UPI00048C6987|nr:hypothetical protein [Ruminococcus flavefaciens]